MSTRTRSTLTAIACGLLLAGCTDPVEYQEAAPAPVGKTAAASTNCALAFSLAEQIMKVSSDAITLTIEAGQAVANGDYPTANRKTDEATALLKRVTSESWPARYGAARAACLAAVS